jgi:hypothetical protein
VVQSRAELDAARTVQGLGGAVIEISLAAVVQAKLKEARDAGLEAEEKERLRERAIEPPLGWSLSEDVRGEMDDVLKNRGGGLRRELEILQALLRGEVGGPEDSCNAR